MRYIEAPESLTSLVRPAVFLAGGITNCPDWQSDVLLQLEEEPRLQDINFSVLNPRRKDFDTSVTDAAEKQIEWEWNALRTVDIRLFWFPSCDSAQTVQPIALFELGRWSALSGELLVGTDSLYPRAFDVKMQLSLERPNIPIHATLDSLTQALIHKVVALYYYLAKSTPTPGRSLRFF